ncbi:sensor histidine kinase [Paenibacillus eucommiae]|uniref:histidine kinase n=1 Tax=Paenibacillus eucommiae TaxID=1355755 RepID=A0ABS4J9X3_9BACL|nr:sensor histidine kinase [Paenibacillus eucommiae]MBP1996658.1 signal transduction histidine kinase [Paenibacillus eucommiae]
MKPMKPMGTMKLKKSVFLFGHFVRDRIMYLLSFLVCSICIVTIAVLGISSQTGSYRESSIAYLFILTIIFALAPLVIDYLRQAAFHRSIEALIDSKEHAMDAFVGLAPGITRDQQLLTQAMAIQYAKYMELLEQYRGLEERRQIFTTQWVHQMKTPVSVIDLLTQEETVPSKEDPQKKLSSIREENERIAHNLEMVLYEARLGQFEHDLHLGRVHLNKLLRTVINGYKTSLIRAHIYPSLTGDEAEVETDEKWMIFVVNQVVSNAIKYSKLREGTKRLHIQVTQGPVETRLTLADEGIGIPEQDLLRVFDPFFTGENGRKTKESTGMGLFLANEVCQRLGHELSIESTEGSGTKVTICFTGKSIFQMN